MAERKKGVFADLLDGTFTIMGRTWLTSLLLGGVLFIPTSFFFGWAYGAFMDSLKDVADSSSGGESGRQLVALGLGYLWIILAALAQGVVFLYVRACVTEHAALAVRGEKASTFAIAGRVFTRKYGRLLGQRVVQYAILTITLGGAAAIAGLAGGVAGALQAEALSILLITLVVLAGLGVVIWISIRYAVTLESLVIDDMGIDESLDQSMALVAHRWWRVFGYTLLFGLIVSFASTLIATPVMFFSTIRQFMRALEAMLRESSGSEGFNAIFLRLMSGLGRRLGILQYIQGLLSAFVTPVFMTLLFLELKKARELREEATAAPSEQVSAPVVPDAPAAPPETLS